MTIREVQSMLINVTIQMKPLIIIDLCSIKYNIYTMSNHHSLKYGGIIAQVGSDNLKLVLLTQ